MQIARGVTRVFITLKLGEAFCETGTGTPLRFGERTGKEMRSLKLHSDSYRSKISFTSVRCGCVCWMKNTVFLKTEVKCGRPCSRYFVFLSIEGESEPMLRS